MIKKNGSALVLSLILLSTLSLALLAVLTINIGQMEVLFSLGDSLIAFYVADGATEQALFNIFQNSDYNPFSGSFSNGAVFSSASTIFSDKIVIRTSALFRKTQRAIETTLQL